MSRGNYKTKVIKRCRCRSHTHYHCTQKLKCHKENILWLKFCNECCCCCCRRLRSERSQGASTSGQESSWKGAQEARRRGSFQVVTCHDMPCHVMSCCRLSVRAGSTVTLTTPPSCSSSWSGSSWWRRSPSSSSPSCTPSTTGAPYYHSVSVCVLVSQHYKPSLKTLPCL